MTTYSPNLVVNGDFSEGNIGFVSDYSYVVFNNSETQYMVLPVSKPSELNGWGRDNLSAVSTDPLGGDGNVLYANGATEPNKLVWGETVSVTPNTDYVFSFYAVDLNNGPSIDHRSSDAVLLGSINGVASVQLETNTNWQQVTLIWNSGSNTTAHLSLVDLNTSGGANDFAVDLISFAPFSPVTTSDRGGIQQGSTLTVNAANGVLANDIDPIAGDTLHVSAVNGQATNVGHAIAGHYGSLTLNPDGSYTYTAASSAVLPTGGVGQDVFTYTASTGPGSTADTTLTVNVSATGTTYISAAPGTTLAAPSGGHAPVLDGGAGNVTLVASNGATVMIGGPSDKLTGGKGSDTYVFTGHFGQDTITNYNAAKDLIELDHTEFNGLAAVQAAAHQVSTNVGTNVVISDNAGDSVTLVGVNLSQMHFDANHFVLA